MFTLVRSTEQSKQGFAESWSSGVRHSSSNQHWPYGAAGFNPLLGLFYLAGPSHVLVRMGDWTPPSPNWMWRFLHKAQILKWWHCPQIALHPNRLTFWAVPQAFSYYFAAVYDFGGGVRGSYNSIGRYSTCMRMKQGPVMNQFSLDSKTIINQASGPYQIRDMCPGGCRSGTTTCHSTEIRIRINLTIVQITYLATVLCTGLLISHRKLQFAQPPHGFTTRRDIMDTVDFNSTV